MIYSSKSADNKEEKKKKKVWQIKKEKKETEGGGVWGLKLQKCPYNYSPSCCAHFGALEGRERERESLVVFVVGTNRFQRTRTSSAP